MKPATAKGVACIGGSLIVLGLVIADTLDLTHIDSNFLEIAVFPLLLAGIAALCVGGFSLGRSWPAGQCGMAGALCFATLLACFLAIAAGVLPFNAHGWSSSIMLVWATMIVAGAGFLVAAVIKAGKKPVKDM